MPTAPAATTPLASVLSTIRHGSHFCAFYETPDDLLELVTNFFDAGERRRDLCAWMMPDGPDGKGPESKAQAALADRGIELQPARQLYHGQESFESGPVVDFWIAKLGQAMASNHAGLSATGDTCWLQQRDWQAFMAYENGLNGFIADREIALLCTYPLSACKAGDLYDVVRAHQVSLAKRGKDWAVIEAHQTDDRADALDAADRVASLTPRQREVLNRVANGQMTKMIAFELGLSARTVEVYREKLIRRLGVRTMAEAVRLWTLAAPAAGPQPRAGNLEANMVN
jgi:DNA-binding CsgD family transcriptional regulator